MLLSCGVVRSSHGASHNRHTNFDKAGESSHALPSASLLDPSAISSPPELSSLLLHLRLRLPHLLAHFIHLLSAPSSRLVLLRQPFRHYGSSLPQRIYISDLQALAFPDLSYHPGLGPTLSSPLKTRVVNGLYGHPHFEHVHAPYLLHPGSIA